MRGLAHLILAAALVAVVVFGPRDRWAPTAVASAALLASLGLVGHAAMQTGAEGVLHRGNHAVHLLDGGGLDRRPRSFRHVPRRLRANDTRREAVTAMMRFSFYRPIHRRGDRSHRRRQHRADLRSSADPAGHALPRASGCENRDRRDHDPRRPLQSLSFSRRNSSRARGRSRSCARPARRRSRSARSRSPSSACSPCSTRRSARAWSAGSVFFRSCGTGDIGAASALRSPR